MYICLDIGGSFTKHAVVNNSDLFVEYGKFPTVNGDKPTFNTDFIEQVKKIIDFYVKKYNIVGIGISCAGHINVKTSEIINSSMYIPYSYGFNFRQLLAEYNLPIICDNDVNCAGIFYLSKVKYKSLIAISVGTGIGGAIIINNKLIRGHSYSCGEIGQMFIKNGRFEELASTKALLDNYYERTKLKVNGETIFELAKVNDPIAIECIDEFIDYLAMGIANLATIFNPQVIMISGAIIKQKEYLQNRTNEAIKKYLHHQIYSNTIFEFSGFSDSANLLGVKVLIDKYVNSLKE